ncbi:hypothetical protein KSF_003750 [Reticulibacter mediterranei]|uniref:Uncharacterized protein n=2 Tax=Reticulibacter mediterranei TaxID=2778369 RepID=A0A8J3IEV6_9CHLR|nr:hypothetical protein KSF_003750 [Reticulibacter mediterranei]
MYSQGTRFDGITAFTLLSSRKTHLSRIAIAPAIHSTQLMGWLWSEPPAQIRISPFKQLMQPAA